MALDVEVVQADAGVQCRRRHVLDRTAMEGRQSVLQGDELESFLFRRHGHAEIVEVGREGRRLHHQDHAQPAGSAVPRRSRDGVCGDPVEGICRCHAEGRHAREDRPGSDRHRPILSAAVPEGRRDPVQGVPRVLGRQGEDRRSRLLDHAGCIGSLGQAPEGRMRRDALSEPGRPRRDQERSERHGAGTAGPQCRLSGVPDPEEAFRRRARAQGDQHGDRQEGDHRRRLSVDGHRGQEPDPAHDVVVQRQHQGRSVRSGSRPRSC